MCIYIYIYIYLQPSASAMVFGRESIYCVAECRAQAWDEQITCLGYLIFLFVASQKRAVQLKCLLVFCPPPSTNQRKHNNAILICTKLFLNLMCTSGDAHCMWLSNDIKRTEWVYIVKCDGCGPQCSQWDVGNRVDARVMFSRWAGQQAGPGLGRIPACVYHCSIPASVHTAEMERDTFSCFCLVIPLEKHL